MPTQPFAPRHAGIARLWTCLVQASHRARRRRPGFSLVEILVVLAIIGLLMGLVGPQVLKVLGDARGKTANVQIHNLGEALDVFYLDAGRYPTPEEGLDALLHRPPEAGGWNGPYVKGAALPKDPWGRPYVYRVPGRNGEPYEITSLGPSGRADERTDGLAGGR